MRDSYSSRPVGPAGIGLAGAAAVAGVALLLYGRLFWTELVMLLATPFGTEISEPDLFWRWAAAVAVGGALLVVSHRLLRGRRQPCVRCGRRHPTVLARRTDPSGWWAYVAGYLAVAGATVRMAKLADRWAAGELPISGPGDPFVWFALALALAGSLLPLALVHRWGRIWPRWVLGLAGRPVPRWLVLGPAIAVGVGMLSYFGNALVLLLSGDPSSRGAEAEIWGYTVWAVGLLAGAVSYARLTRGGPRTPHEPVDESRTTRSAPDDPVPRARRAWMRALLVSYLAGLVAAVWWMLPGTYPYGADQDVRVGLNTLLERPAGCVLLFASGLLGLLIASAGIRSASGRRPDERSPGRWARPVPRGLALVGAGLQAMFFAWVLSDTAVLSTTGYLTALAAPPALVVLLVVLLRRRRAVVPALLGLIGLVTLVVLLTASGTLTSYLGALAGGVASFGGRVLWSWAMAIAAIVWVWPVLERLTGLIRTIANGDPTLRRSLPAWARPESVRRWGPVATVVAALGPVPYAIARLSWLTPWHLLTGAPDPATGRIEVVWLSTAQASDPTVQLQGVLFVGPATAGMLLTLGLVCRWGEVLPRWIPMYGGRPVPMALAVVPGASAAALLIVAAPGVLVGPLREGDLNDLVMGLVFMPLPVWGPSLALAVLAYALRRAQSRPIAAEVD